MPIPVDIVAQINRQSLDDVRGSLRNAFSGAGKDLGQDFDRTAGRAIVGSAQRTGQQAGAEMAKGLRGALNEAFAGFASNFGIAGKQADAVFSGITSKASVAALGVAGVGAAAIIAGKQLYDLGAQWDDVADAITARTGQIGNDLKATMKEVEDAVRNTAAPMDDIGDVAGRVVQSFRLSGDPLEKMTKTIADLNEMTGEKLNIRDLGKVFRFFKVDVEKNGIDVLNELNTASQRTGLPINDLISSLKDAGPAAKDFKLNIGETAALIATLEEAGVSDTLLKPALQRFASRAAKDGKDVRAELESVINQIATLPEAAARQLAADSFGSKNFEPIFQVIRDGTLDVESLKTSLGGIGPTIEQQRDATEDWHEEWQKLVNTVKVELAPAAGALFSDMNEDLKGITTTMREEAQQWIDIFNSVRDLFNFGNPDPSDPSLSGPAELDENGNPVRVPRPGAVANPLDAIANRPTGSASSGGGGGLIGGGAAGAGSPVRTPGSGSGGPGAVGLGSIIGSGAVPSPASMAAIAKAQAMDGLPYSNNASTIVNGQDVGRTDCSGYLSQVYSAMSGRTAWFTTMSDFEALGFRRGYMPGALNIGNTRKPGMSGHMAGTLPNGVNIESGGASGGVSYNSGPGALGPQFQEVWHYMPGYYDGGLASAQFDDGGKWWFGEGGPRGVYSGEKGGRSRGRGDVGNGWWGSGGPGTRGEGSTPFFRPGSVPWWELGIGRGSAGGPGSAGAFGSGGTVSGPSGRDVIPARLTAGEFVVNADSTARWLPLLQRINDRSIGAGPGFDDGGMIPLRSPRGTDPRGDKDGESPSLGPFAPWWDMDWMPPENPQRVGKPLPGVDGKWWHRGPAPGRTPFRFPPIGKHRKPVPGDDQFWGDSRIKLWGSGFNNGGLVPSLGNLLDPNDMGSQVAGAALSGAQEQGGWVGLGASFAQMGLELARQQQQQQGTSMPAGGFTETSTPSGRGPGEGLPGTGQQSGSGGGGVIGAAAGMFPGGGVAAQMATRTAKFGGQLLAIGGQGLMETFLPNGSPLGDPMASWLGRGLQGVSQVRPAGTNTAGAQAPIAQDTHVGRGGQAGPGGPASQPGQAPLIGEMHVTSPSDSQQIARDIDRQVRAYGAGGGR